MLKQKIKGGNNIIGDKIQNFVEGLNKNSFLQELFLGNFILLFFKLKINFFKLKKINLKKKGENSINDNGCISIIQGLKSNPFCKLEILDFRFINFINFLLLSKNNNS